MGTCASDGLDDGDILGVLIGILVLDVTPSVDGDTLDAGTGASDGLDDGDALDAGTGASDGLDDGDALGAGIVGEAVGWVLGETVE